MLYQFVQTNAVLLNFIHNSETYIQFFYPFTGIDLYFPRNLVSKRIFSYVVIILNSGDFTIYRDSSCLFYITEHAQMCFPAMFLFLSLAAQSEQTQVICSKNYES